MPGARIALLAGATLLGSCDSFGPEDVRVLLTTEAEVYTAPAAVGVRLLNLSTGTIHHGVCPRREQLVADAWVAVEADEVPSCPLPLVINRPGQAHVVYAHFDEPGEYRVLMWVSTADDERVSEPFISNTFIVEAPAQ